MIDRTSFGADRGTAAFPSVRIRATFPATTVSFVAGRTVVGGLPPSSGEDGRCGRWTSGTASSLSRSSS